MSRSDDELRDRLEIADLVQRYAVLVDERDVDGVVGLFTADAVLVSPDPPRSLLPTHEAAGPTGIRAAMAPLASLVRTVHEVHGHLLETLGAGEAAGRTTGTAHHLSHAGDGYLDVVWRVIYRDAFRRTDDGWRFARRELTLTALETRPVARVLPHDPGDPA